MRLSSSYLVELGLMIRKTISDQLKQAMLAKDKAKLASLRYVWSLIKNAEIDKKSELNDEEIVKLVAREVKTRKEAIEQFAEAGRDDLVSEEREKLKVLEALLPEMMGRDEVEKLVDNVVGSGKDDFGEVMKEVMGKVKGKAEGKLVAEVVKEKLGNK